MSFLFVPRKVARTVKSTTSANNSRNLPCSISSSGTSISGQSSERNAVGNPLSFQQGPSVLENEHTSPQKPNYTVLPDELYARFIALSLSDYAFWSNVDLRRATGMGEDGYIPLVQLFHLSDMLQSISSQCDAVLEKALVKAARTHAKSIEIRMRILDASSDGRYRLKETSGIYEIRRRDWKSVLERCATYSTEYWDRRTVYMESIPPSLRTFQGIIEITLPLVGIAAEGRTNPTTDPQLENVLFPGPDSRTSTSVSASDERIQKCRGFTLVTLSDVADAEALMRAWTWSRQDSDIELLSNYKQLKMKEECQKVGLRALSKSRWDELNSEYLAYRRRLIDEMATHQDQDYHSSTIAGPGHSPTMPSLAEIKPLHTESWSNTPTPIDESCSSYPHGCLVFARHIHPETNKTTVRALFSRAFQAGAIQEDGVDYVDYAKGMDSCYLRLATARHATILVNHFKNQPTVQNTGLDDTGTAGPGIKHSIELEVVKGRREELYWEKVPLKIQQQATERAMGKASRPNDVPDVGTGKSRKKRKR